MFIVQTSLRVSLFKVLVVLLTSQMVYCADFSKHMNHSDESNLFDTEDNLQEIAFSDIAAGKELMQLLQI